MYDKEELDLMFITADGYDGPRRFMPESSVMEMRNAYEKRIAELEAQVIEWKGVVGRLRETEQWLPLGNRKTIGDERWPQTVWVVIGEHGFSFCTPYSTDHIRLPEGYALCRKVQP